MLRRGEVPLGEPLPAAATRLVEEVHELCLRALEAVLRLVEVLAVVPAQRQSERQPRHQPPAPLDD